MRTSNIIKHVFIGSIPLMLCAVPPKTITVYGSSGRQPVYGALYYVQSHSAQRVGHIKMLDREQEFNVPVVTSNSRRYLIISRQPSLLKEVFTQPFYAPGVLLIPLPAVRQNVQPPIVLDEAQLAVLNIE